MEGKALGENLFGSGAGLEHGSHETSTGSKLSFYYSPRKNLERPVLVLLHGWPQT